jgi:hypothetical protein
MACQIKRKDNGTIDTVLAPNGKPSVLYNSLVNAIASSEVTRNVIQSDPYVSSVMDSVYVMDNTAEELALAAWSKAYTIDFIDSFGNWKEDKLPDTDSNGEPTVNMLFPEITDTGVKPGVSELFDSNPELANQVYEALGYKTEAAKRVEKANEDIKEIQKIGVDTEYEDVVKSSDKNRFHFLDTNIFTDKNQKSVNIEHVRVPEKYRNKGYGLSMYIVRGEELLKEGKFLISYDQHSPEAETVWQRLLQLGLATQEGEYGTYQYVGLKNQEITPEQKQQALQLYSQYLDTIFPNSKVKDIVYHGSLSKFDSFLKGVTKRTTSSDGIWFTDSKELAKEYSISEKIVHVGIEYDVLKKLKSENSAKSYKISSGLDADNYQDFVKKYGENKINQGVIIETENLNIVYPSIVNIKNLKIIDGEGFNQFARDKEVKKAKNENKDGLIIKNTLDTISNNYDLRANTITVFEPEQIHILGTPQDIEGFKKFVSKPTQPVSNEWTNVKNNCPKLI